jgi:hypothetical protein
MAERRTQVRLSGLERSLEVSAQTLAAVWMGPPELDARVLATRIAQALDAPRDYPSLRENVVPGDRVRFVVDLETPAWPAIVEAMIERLLRAGVALADIAVVGPPGSDRPAGAYLAPEVAWLTHVPEDRAELAYLANTKRGRRVYLNRQLVDADVVLPIGRLWHDEPFGLRGPWSVIFPDASDTATRREFRGGALKQLAHPEPGIGHGKEAAEVGWLLGARLQVAVLSGGSGLADVLAGDVSGLLDAGHDLVERHWTFPVSERADLVIAGVGESGSPGGWDAITRAIASAQEIVAKSGRIVVASRAIQAPGPALQHLAEADDPAEALRSLHALEDQPDYPAALRLARRDLAVPVALLSHLSNTTVDDLGLVALRDLAEIEKLAEKARRVVVINRAELTRVRRADDL